MNCWVIPCGTLAVCGLTAIDTSAAAATVRTVEPEIAPEVALMFDVPIPTLVANPVLLMVAVVVVPDAQVAVAVKFCVLLSVKVPVAVKCWVVPNAIDGVAGVTAIETSAAAVTVRVVLPETPFDAAVISVDPLPTVVASPCDPEVLLIVATLVVAELHCAVVVMSCVVPSVNLAVA